MSPIGTINLTHKKLYWILQILGWSSITLIETINYYFFIIGEFQWEYFYQFLILSALGLFVSHFYKILFVKPEIFEKGTARIWTFALRDVLGITFFIILVLYSPFLFTSISEGLDKNLVISILGQFMNVGRYVLVWIIIYYLYHLMHHMSEVAKQKLHLESLAKSAELELLKSQLNPHFLFNSLNSIKALVLIDPEKSRDAIIKLSELLRFSLNYEKAHLITLEEEMTQVEKYLELEQIRFGKRLEVIISMEEATLEHKIPPGMILTLAENAIKHGITQLPDGGEIKINTKLRGQKMYVEVLNSGQLRSNFKMGIGLRNVKSRLLSLFPKESNFELNQIDSSQISAVLTYPVS